MSHLDRAVGIRLLLAGFFTGAAAATGLWMRLDPVFFLRVV